MDTKQALETLESALNLATTKGAFNLSETNQIVNALITLKSSIEDKKMSVINGSE